MRNTLICIILSYVIIAVMMYAYIEGEKYTYMTEVIKYNERH